jgi:acetyl-CoA carboxylase carboxyltransferase component/biotin carboxyl carrier protein
MHGKSGDVSTASASSSISFQESHETDTPLKANPVTPEGLVAITSPMQGTIISISSAESESVRPSQLILVMEAMKMEHEICSEVSGVLAKLNVSVGDTVFEDHVLAFVEPSELEDGDVEESVAVDLDHVRADVAEVIERHEVTLDRARPDAVEKRRKTNQRTARENIDDLCDAGTFSEYGQLVLTPGTGLSREEVIRKFPTDGMITGIGSINGQHFDTEISRCVVMSYDYTVLAGTQGAINHPKTDRMLELAAKWKRPVVFFTEGGGGRAGTGGKREGGRSTTPAKPGQDDSAGRPLDTPTFATMGRLSGTVPLVGITSRFCFAGNASLLGCCDVIIATKDANIGMGGPALIEGGNLGVFRPEEIGPIEVQTKSGVVDIAVADEAEAVKVAKKYLSYFQGRISDWECADQRLLRNIVPENRLRVYNVRDVIDTLADTGSVLELRPDFGLGMVTAFIRIDGRPIGVLANNPIYLSGAIDSDGSDKAARFLQLMDGFDIPILVLCDTPGMMVGPEIERTGLVRHCSRLFVTGANLTVPHVTIVLRKAYGLGAQAMAGGSFKEPFCVVAWPTGEFGGMGLEGQVKLGFRNELAAMQDPEERLKRYDDLVDAAYARGRALNSGVSFAVDDVIDPADSRKWITNAFDSVPPTPAREGKKRRNIDTW